LGEGNHESVALALIAATAVGMATAFVKSATLFNPKKPSDSTEIAEQKKTPPRKRRT